MNTKDFKKLVFFLLKFPFLKSLLASIRAGKIVFVHKDKDKDFIYRWKNGAAITSNPAHNPNGYLKSLKCFLYDYKPNYNDIAVIVGVADGFEVPYFCQNTKKLICIEPTSSCIRRLKKLKRILSLSNLILINCAVGKESCQLPLTINKNHDVDNRINFQNINHLDDYEIVKVEKMTKILKDFGNLNIDYCKINIEGEEKNALLGLDLSQIKIKKFCISSHDFMGPSTRTYDWVKSWLIKNNYSIKSYPEKFGEFSKNYFLFGELKEK